MNRKMLRLALVGGVLPVPLSGAVLSEPRGSSPQ